MADRTRLTIGEREVGADRPCFIIVDAGIPARQLGEVIGRTSKRAIEKDRLIAWGDLV